MYHGVDDFVLFWASHVHELYSCPGSVLARIRKIPDRLLPPGVEDYELPYGDGVYSHELSDHRCDLLDADILISCLTAKEKDVALEYGLCLCSEDNPGRLHGGLLNSLKSKIFKRLREKRWLK